MSTFLSAVVLTALLVLLVLIDLSFGVFGLFVQTGGGLWQLFNERAYQTADMCVHDQKEHIKTYWYFLLLYAWWIVSAVGVSHWFQNTK